MTWYLDILIVINQKNDCLKPLVLKPVFASLRFETKSQKVFGPFSDMEIPLLTNSSAYLFAYFFFIKWAQTFVVQWMGVLFIVYL